MDDYFDKPVHPLYSVTAFISALIVLILLISGTRNRKGIEKNHKLIFLWVIFFCLQDGVWGLFASHVFYSDRGLFFVSNVFHLSAVFSAFAWTLYFLSRIRDSMKRSRIYVVLSAAVALVQLGMIIANLNSPFMFFVDETGWYQTTDWRSILFYLQFSTYILIGIASLIGTAREKEGSGGEIYAVFFVNLSPLLFGVFQLIYPDAPVDSIGFAIACVIIELFLSRDYEEQVYTLRQLQEQLQSNLAEISRQNEIIEKNAGELRDFADQLSNYKRAVLSDALISLEVNLTRDELYYGVWKDDAGSEVPLSGIIGMEVPCSYDAYILEWNRRFVKDSGMFSFSTDRDSLLDAFERGTTEVTFDYEAKTVSGRSTWLRRSICMTSNQAGDVIAFTSVKDISALVDQTKREEAYVMALATEYDSIAVVDFSENKLEDRVIMHGRMSRDISDIVGSEAANEECFTKRLDLLSRFVHPEDREQYHTRTRRESIFTSFAANKTHVVDFRILKPDGSGDYLYYQFRFVSLRNDDGNTTGMIACMRNTDAEVRKEYESRQALVDAKIAAEAANQAKSTFLFNMSHDIRTPMNAILGFTDIAEKHIDEKERVLEALGKVKMSGNLLLTLINDVLDMSRVESGAVKPEAEPVCIEVIMDNLYSILNTSAETKNLLFTIKAAPSLTHRWCMTDRLLTMRVLTNIISNSVKYTDPGGWIDLLAEELPCEREGYARYRFTISDTGHGMSEEFLTHLFEPFARAESATKSGVTGTGLGMAITKSLTELMGGSISVESELGRGTTVRLEFENEIAEPVSHSAVDTEEIAVELAGKKILLVEDNELNREIAMDILEEEGILVDTAEDGDIAVEKLRDMTEGEYDLVLMDIQMPRMNGYDATRAIRALPNRFASALPIVAMTANAFEEDRQNALAAGMNGHLAKPIDIPKLLATLSELLS